MVFIVFIDFCRINGIYQKSTVKYRYRAQNGISTFTELSIYFWYYRTTLVTSLPGVCAVAQGAKVQNFVKLPCFGDLVFICPTQIRFHHQQLGKEWISTYVQRLSNEFDEPFESAANSQ